ncbi:MAG TPA: hypothetical protein PLV06_11815 [Bacteroidales bacterium]|nr:hypothetical protein [Bacteroidales bacterium]HPF03004.1 hypothetical protein [Bacteroidales bacterium]HPJ59971.1 hypothetical protein [Bacteroidales bacterium]HPR13064.1 hypothetical protein [Bacteroidales bacterium]HRW85684.1 hypothetical protein [Bacteroidales bacterium]
MEETITPDTIEIGEETIKDLNTVRKWTMFFSILGFIAIGLMFIIGLVAGVFLLVFDTGPAILGMPEWIVIIIIFALTALFFFPLFFLNRFAQHTGNAVKKYKTAEIRHAFRNLRNYCIYMGVLVILLLVSYFIVFIAAGASVALLKDFGPAI